jgi:hypothetical protein
LNAGAAGASAVSGSQNASDAAVTTNSNRKPSKIRRSIFGPLRCFAPQGYVAAMSSDGKRLSFVEADLRRGAQAAMQGAGH